MILSSTIANAPSSLYITYLIFMILNAVTNVILFTLMIRFYLNGVKFYRTNQYKQFNDIQIYELKKELETLKNTSNLERDKQLSEINRELQILKKQIQKEVAVLKKSSHKIDKDKLAELNKELDIIDKK